MLNIKGLVKITKIEDMKGGKSAKACIYFGTKKKNSQNGDEWENSFFNAVLVGKAFEKSYDLVDKESIFITEGIVKNASYEDKQGNKRSYLSLTVFDYVAGEEEIGKMFNSSKSEKKEETPRRERQQRNPRQSK